ncbi:MAG: type II toxin-antitoxin system RelE/ParE family toxin [Candidatus Acidiferrum sp.]
MRVIWTEAAINHLIEVRDYVARDKPEAARQLAQKIRKSIARLALLPHLGRAGREPETRELIIGGTPYIVCYQVHRERLIILAIIHSARERSQE